ncbi:hypothetical protein J2S20_001206 [Moryella indoligenes]|uniref:NodB homology domain-containing protein n=1 Tax=Moryella indoligenes TaxID=371674 RepID=A0AAE4AKR5_9FIRM|nr:polysaccharide deacetylase family protein [Moryella indoligenes]MDQ0152514.1 hypothetical protein [Moryella indoligenes]
MSYQNYGGYYRGSGQRSRRRRRPRSPLPLIICIVLLLLIGAAFMFGKVRDRIAKSTVPAETEATVSEADQSAASEAPDADHADSSAETIPAAETTLARAERLAAQYDYDAAIALITEDSALAASEQGQAAIQGYEATKSTLVRQNISEITHVFFHTLIMDNKKAFDGDNRQDGYNDVMTTKSEFLKMMQSMYERGYVLVSIHDICYEVDDTEKGGKKMVAGDIMLPEGKHAFVLSQDDVNYYEYMDGDGFAKCLIVGEDGKPKNEMIMDDGSISVGSYDVVPLLDDFVEEHPDFSYRGAKGIVAVTGYNGVFGYRTDNSYEETNPNIEADRQKVREVAQCLRDDGWEIASHSWGHRNYGSISMEDLREDNRKWQERVAPLIGGTDILIYPFGADIADWHPYTNDNERFNLLWASGFRYFCNVDSSPYFVQKGNDFMRMGRRNLDGYRMWQDMTVKNHTSDLFNAADIFDPDRPTPVPDYNGG